MRTTRAAALKNEAIISVLGARLWMISGGKIKENWGGGQLLPTKMDSRLISSEVRTLGSVSWGRSRGPGEPGRADGGTNSIKGEEK